MEEFKNDICKSCTNGSFDKCDADFEQITLDAITRNVVDCNLYQEKPRHKLKITYECEGKIATVEKEVYELPDVEWHKVSQAISQSELCEIVDYLNKKIGANYRTSNKKMQSLIKARAEEGYTVDDFKTVIDKKFNSWGKDPKMSLYLRPTTLFGTKFSEYLNEYQALSPDRLQTKPSFDIDKISRDALNNLEI